MTQDTFVSSIWLALNVNFDIGLMLACPSGAAVKPTVVDPAAAEMEHAACRRRPAYKRGPVAQASENTYASVWYSLSGNAHDKSVVLPALTAAFNRLRPGPGASRRPDDCPATMLLMVLSIQFVLSQLLRISMAAARQRHDQGQVRRLAGLGRHLDAGVEAAQLLSDRPIIVLSKSICDDYALSATETSKRVSPSSTSACSIFAVAH